jgi:hypothetical protein
LFLGDMVGEMREAEMGDKRIPIRYVAAWMIGLAVLLYILILVFGALPANAHIDFAAIVLVVVAAAAVALLLSPKWDATVVEALTRIRAFQFASLKVELEAIRARQDEQTSRLDLLQLLAPLVLTQAEQKHLLNLHYRKTAGYKGNNEVRSELRRLRYLGLIINARPIASAADGSKFDLAEIVQLTLLGAKWAKQLVEMEKARLDVRRDPGELEAKTVVQNP